MQKIKTIKDLLTNLYKSEPPERGGFILPNKVVEVQNIFAQPADGFMATAADIIKYTEENDAWATWHTHPNQSCNLSQEDAQSFRIWPCMFHFVIGNDGVKCFKYDKDKGAILEVD